MGLPASGEPLPASSGELDLPRLQVGESLAGRFTILRFIARGGMGAVYEANDVMLRSRVALKVIRGRIATDAAAMEQFRREVLLARRIGHANVCHVYELFEATTAAGMPIHFLTMELLEGETLSQRIAREGRLTMGEAFPLVQQLCWGLAAAHTAGVIHRDFKCSNVLLVPGDTSSGESTAQSTRVVITDFGIARAVQLGSGQTTNGPLTGGRAFVGTPEYMAPEQVADGAVTQATDIYSLGVVIFEMVTGKLPFTGDTPLVAAAKRLNESPPRPEATVPGLDAKWSSTILRCLAREPERRFRSALDILPALEGPPQHWRRWVGLGAGTLLVALATFAGVRVFPSFHQLQQPRTAVPMPPRRALAILGVRDELASRELDWLPTAVAESLGHELAAAETSLRVIPSDRVASVRRSLGVSEDTVTEEKVRERMQGLLAANFLVYGTLKPVAQGSASVELSVRMADAISGQELASIEEDLGDGAIAVQEKVPTVAERLRRLLGLSLSDAQVVALSTSRARNLSATKPYAQGVMSLRKFDYGSARSSFEAALAMDGSFPEARRRLAETWEHEGNRKRAREVAEPIRSKQTNFTSRQLAELDAKLLSLGPEPGQGALARQALFEATPDDVELGLALAEEQVETAPKTANAIVSRLREQPAPASADIRLDGAEAAAAWRLGDGERAKELLAEVKARARALGARTELANALTEEETMLWQGGKRPVETMGPPFQEAVRLLSEAGDLIELAGVEGRRAGLAMERFPLSMALKSAEETAALYRRLGDRAGLSSVLSLYAYELLQYGQPDLATRTVAEAMAESEAIHDRHLGDAVGFYTSVQGFVAMQRADLDGIWNAARLLRSQASQGECALCFAAAALREEDRLPEARETLEKAMASEIAGGNHLAAFVSQTRLCELSCDEGHPVEGIACFGEHPPPVGAAGTAWVLELNPGLAKCRFEAGDLDGAGAAAVEGLALAQHLQWYVYRVLSNAYLMRVRAARGQTAKALASLRADLHDSESRKTTKFAFEIALQLGEVELAAGRPEGRPRLLKLEQEAKSRQHFRIARLAREALDGKPAATSPAK